MAINTPYGTLAFPHLFQPRPRAEGGEAVFSATHIYNPAQQQSPAYKAMIDACIEAAKKEFGDKAGKYNGFEPGHQFINPWTKTKPGIVNAQRQEVLLPEEVWAGQLVRLNITPV